jgi:L-methionine (R)-S-oxide reductase
MNEYNAIDTSLPKAELYGEIRKHIASLIDGEPDITANLANTASVLKMGLPTTTWAGFYLLKDNQLVLGPFQGKPACVRIEMGMGVCGTAAERRETLIIADVSKFPGHIYCDPDSRSEIVVPLADARRVYGVIDLDSNVLDAYDAVDKENLEKIAEMLMPHFRDTYE